MDTTETFIKMRLSAIPDLGRGVPYADTFCALSNLRHFVDRKGDFYVWMQEEPTWCQLERQDQLQEMVKDIRDKQSGKRLRLVTAFYTWLREGDDGEGDDLAFALRQLDYNSFEQLWLAFVMKENHGKVWDGEEWVLSQVRVGGKDG